jgi:hypothetical protein
MVGKWSSVGFSDLADRLNEAVSWLGRFGIQVERGRLGAYRKAINELVTLVAKKSSERRPALFPKSANDLFEANEIATIHAAFADGRHDDFVRERLQAFAGGPLRYVDEDPSSSSNRPRDLAFELLVGARLIASGLQLEAAGLADVSATVGLQRLIFECKRPQSEKRIERRAIEARDQLLERCRDASSVGVIAIDTTKLTNPDFRVLTGVSSVEGTRRLGAHLADFYRQRLHLWQRVASRRVVALLLRVSILAHFSKDKSLSYCQQYLLVGLSTGGPVTRETLERLSTALDTGADQDVDSAKM